MRHTFPAGRRSPRACRGGRFFESSIPRGNFSRSRMTAAATTGPASGAHPASSTPASGCGKSSSSLKAPGHLPPLKGGQGYTVVENSISHEGTKKKGATKSCDAFAPYLLVWIRPSATAGSAGFAGLVEEDDVAVGVAQPRLAPHPRLVARAMLERDPAPRQLLDPFVEVVAFEIDGGRRDDLLLGIDLDREGRPARRLEARIVGRVVDDLLEAEPA